MDNLLSFIFKAVSVEPSYEPNLCLATGRTVACSACSDACPHDAIRVGRGVEIDDVACTGCGLCVQACPTGALEPKLSLERGSSIKCSQVRGSGQGIQCLARLQPTDVLRLVGSRPGVTLARGDCATCPIGGENVAEVVTAVGRDAEELAQLHHREVQIEVVETEVLDQDRRGDALSRRELLRGGWRTLQERTGDMLAPLDPGEDKAGLPSEMQRRYRVISAAAPQPNQHVPWRLPRIDVSCIMCPMCTNACPTDALERVFNSGSEGVLELQPELCMGCNACVEACPVGAVEMDDHVQWQELSGGRKVAYLRDSKAGPAGSLAR